MSAGTFFVLLLFLSVGIGMIAFSYRIRSKAAQSRVWPTTTGRIQTLEFDDSMDADGSATTYQVNVEYAYSVRGVKYTSTRIAFGYSASPSRQAQLDLFTRLQKASELVVHYNPRQPSESVLDTGTTPTASRLLMAGIIWTALTLGFFILEFLSANKDGTR